MIREHIKNLLIKAVRRRYGVIEVSKFSVAVPDSPEHGDYATNIALVLGKSLKIPPQKLATEISQYLIQEFKKVEVKPPGFINFWLQEKDLQKAFSEILKNKQNYGKSESGKNKKKRINIEFISANPTGPLTLGNGRGAFLGDTLAKVLSMQGYKITREYYINDSRQSNQIKELGDAILGRGESYKGPYTDEIRERLKVRFADLNKLSCEDAGFAAAQEIQKDNKKFIEKTLKIKFDVWYSEEKLYKNRLVKKVLEKLNKKDVLYNKDGALWFKAGEFGDSEDRVAERTGGAPTYFLPDVAYHEEKLTKRKFDKVIDILGADHHGTFPRVLAGLRALGQDTDRVQAIFTQIVRIKQGAVEVKMSKRKGMYIALGELIKEVGLDAARYFFLEKSPETHIDFDLDIAREQSVKNPVYYVQYAQARIFSILKKAGYEKLNLKINFQLFKEKEELSLIKKLIQYPEVLGDIAADYQVNKLINYSYQLAQAFHAFYEKHRVITENKNLTQARLILIKSIKIVLENIFNTLGISAPTKM